MISIRLDRPGFVFGSAVRSCHILSGVTETKDTLGRYLPWHVAAFSLGAGAVHFAEIQSHNEEYWVFGVFFFFVAWFQAASAVGLVARPMRRLAIFTVVVNLAVVAIWTWSRTTGLPIGPEAGTPEEIGAPDLLATVLEILIVLWGLGITAHAVESRAAQHRLAISLTWTVWASVLAATALVFLTERSAAVAH
jgi:hypothetical protein